MTGAPPADNTLARNVARLIQRLDAGVLEERLHVRDRSRNLDVTIAGWVARTADVTVPFWMSYENATRSWRQRSPANQGYCLIGIFWPRPIIKGPVASLEEPIRTPPFETERRPAQGFPLPSRTLQTPSRLGA